ncbi:hypothetical protein B0O99DRAFT_152620 [Bisporella sp. PMI_857]|nr:hypothetical protein B0O99DRAFT_152620 [Bisporella sp. PMI_857]
MSGIPVYTASPINPNAVKASGVTPKTADTIPSNQGPPVAAATTTTTSNTYPSARPGAAAPAPTAALRYAPVQPTPTTASTTASTTPGPSPPQPGAVPIPPQSSILPPPKAGEKHEAQKVPPQMAIPPPTTAFAGQSSITSTSMTPSAAYPVRLPITGSDNPRRTLDHPPGYQQNVYAAEMTGEQRRTLENASQADNGSNGVIDGEGIWSTAKQWAQTAGTKLQETEAEVWRRINKQ